VAIIYDGLRGARENADGVKKAAEQMEIGFMDVVALAIAQELLQEFGLEDLPIAD
jgi:hypothetical protein